MPQPDLVDLMPQTPVRVDDLGDGRIRLNYLGYAYPTCDRLAGAVIREDEATVSISVDTGHEERTATYCAFPRSMFLAELLDGDVQFYFEEQLDAPLGGRSVVLLP